MSAADPELPPDVDDSDLPAVHDGTPHDPITDDVVEPEDEDGVPEARTATTRRPPHRFALLIGLVILTALGGLTGWLGYRFVNYHHATERRAEFVRVARQGAVNLTTIDWQRADADVQRILDSATGAFYDDFVKRSKPFVDVVKQAQSKSQGTITAAGLQSVTGDEAR
ncbi:MAG: Mce protein, partial [Mycobacterium sp.]